MGRLWNRMFGKCDHRRTMVVSSVGVDRVVCERCGHISFRMTRNVTTSRRAAPSVAMRSVSGL